jgi:hypothetical protein
LHLEPHTPQELKVIWAGGVYAGRNHLQHQLVQQQQQQQQQRMVFPAVDSIDNGVSAGGGSV